MTELLNYIIAQIVSDPEQIKITRTDTEEGIKLDLSVPEEERGMIIGKNGMNIRAIRNLVSVIARREGKRVMIEIID
jgi:hypothetical protein